MKRNARNASESQVKRSQTRQSFNQSHFGTANDVNTTFECTQCETSRPSQMSQKCAVCLQLNTVNQQCTKCVVCCGACSAGPFCRMHLEAHVHDGQCTAIKSKVENLTAGITAEYQRTLLQESIARKNEQAHISALGLQVKNMHEARSSSRQSDGQRKLDQLIADQEENARRLNIAANFQDEQRQAQDEKEKQLNEREQALIQEKVHLRDVVTPAIQQQQAQHQSEVRAKVVELEAKELELKNSKAAQAANFTQQKQQFENEKGQLQEAGRLQQQNQYQINQANLKAQADIQADWQARQNALDCLLYTSPSPRDQRGSRMPSSA